jgi:hypothetical protein
VHRGRVEKVPLVTEIMYALLAADGAGSVDALDVQPTDHAPARSATSKTDADRLRGSEGRCLPGADRPCDPARASLCAYDENDPIASEPMVAFPLFFVHGHFAWFTPRESLENSQRCN